MTLNQRISPSLSEEACFQQEKVSCQFGFTLIELMVVIAIFGTLASVGFSNLGAARHDKKIRIAAGKVKAAMTSARLKALSAGKAQYVGLDIANNRVASTINDASAAQSGYDKATKTWAASTAWESLPGVNVQDAKFTGALYARQRPIKTLEFNPNGRVKKITGGAAKSVRIISADGTSSLVMLLNASRVTGRVKIKECQLAVANAGGC